MDPKKGESLRNSDNSNVTISRPSTSSTVPSSTTLPSNQKSSSGAAVHISVLPVELFLKIFSFLTLDELVSTQFVCINWQDMTRDDCLWKDLVFDANKYCLDEIKSKLQIMPALKNIKGNIPNCAVDLLLGNVSALIRMECSIIPSITTSQIEKINEKYPKLETVRLNVCSPDFCDCVRVIGNNKHLKDIFYDRCTHHNPLCKNNANYMLHFLNKKENFPSLENLRFIDIVYRSALSQPQLRNIIPGIITKRSQVIKSLQFDFYYEMNTKISEAIGKCKCLQELKLCGLSCDQLSVIRFDKHVQLQSFVIDLGIRSDSLLSYTLYAPLCTTSWLNLTKLCITVSYDEVMETQSRLEILKVASENMRELKELTYWDFSHSTSENQLQKLGCLSKLESLTVNGIWNITEEAMKSLSSCLSLKKLDFTSEKSDIKNLDAYVAETVRLMMKLKYLHFYIPDSCSIDFRTTQKIVEFTNRPSDSASVLLQQKKTLPHEYLSFLNQ